MYGLLHLPQSVRVGRLCRNGVVSAPELNVSDREVSIIARTLNSELFPVPSFPDMLWSCAP